MKIDCRSEDKARGQTLKRVESEVYNKMFSIEFRLIILTIVYSFSVSKHKRAFFQTESTHILRYSLISNYLIQPRYKWGFHWKSSLTSSLDFWRSPLVPYSNTKIRIELSHFLGLLRRTKYYYGLLKLKRSKIFHNTNKIRWSTLQRFERHFIKQFFYLWDFGHCQRFYRFALKRPFSNLFIFYDPLMSRRFRRALGRLQRKKSALLRAIRRSKRRRRGRPWKFYKTKRFKIKRRRLIVHLGSLRTKRFLRTTGPAQVAARYSALLLRWRRLLVTNFSSTGRLGFKYKNALDYTSLLTTSSLKDFSFYGEVFNLFFKKKKSNFYLTVTNGFGDVLVHHSSGRLVKFRRNKKFRASMFNLPVLASFFVKKLLRKKIKKISKFYRPAGVSKRALKTLYNIFIGSGVVIKTLVKNSKRPHSFSKKTKKIRRL